MASVGAVHDVAARRWNASEALVGLRLGICLHSADTAAIVYPDKSCKLLSLVEPASGLEPLTC